MASILALVMMCLLGACGTDKADTKLYQKESKETDSSSTQDDTSEDKSVDDSEAGDMTVHFLDVGQGLSILVQSEGQTMIYDGGDRSTSSFVVSYLKEQNVSHALINLGGNVLALGGKPDGSDYNIGIQKPFAQNGEAITSVKIKDQSVVSSGIYERYFKVGDKIYHHILDPKTGYPYKNNLLGVSIVCDSSTEADALSTTCFAMGLDDGLKYIEGIKGAEALFITDDYEIHYSSGFPK